MAQQVAAQLAAQRSATPAQNIVNHYVSQPTFVQHNVSSVSHQVRQQNLTFQQFVMQQQNQQQNQFGRAAPSSGRPGPYAAIANTSQPPPPPPPPGTAAASSSQGPPPPPDYYTPEQRLDYYLAIQQGRRPPNIPRPRRPRTAQPASASASAIVPSMGTDPRDVRAATHDTIQRMHHRRAQGRRREEMAQRGLDADRARRRGPAVGDVVGTGKRKRNLDGMPDFEKRQRVARESYSIAT